MSGRPVSSGFLDYLHSRAPGDGVLRLLRIVHADLGTLRFVRDAQDLVSGGDTYAARGFTLPIPRDDEGVQEVPLELSVVGMDDDLVDDIVEAADERPDVEMELVRISDPDTVEATFRFQMKSASADAGVLKAALVFEPVLVDPYPGPIFDAARFPDLFED